MRKQHHVLWRGLLSALLVVVPLGTYVFVPMAQCVAHTLEGPTCRAHVTHVLACVMCMRSTDWLAARLPLRLARLPRTASSTQRSRRLRLTRAAAPSFLAHVEVTATVLQWYNMLTP